MSRPAILIIDGRRYRWRDLVRLRQAQRDTARQTCQLALFDALPEDRRPAHERTAADRYRQPSLFTRLEDPPPDS
jgi:hypothetical protein